MKINTETLKQLLSLPEDVEFLLKIPGKQDPIRVSLKTLKQLGVFNTNNDNNNFIPLSGTEVGNPVTGDIFLYNSDEEISYEKISYDPIFNSWGVSSTDNVFWVYPTGLRSYLDGYTYDFFSSGAKSFFLTSDDPYFKGIVGGAYFAENYDDNTYTQKKYVDTAMIPLDYGDIENAGGIENTQVYTTGSGTGIASVDLSPIMAIGKDVTVSDLGNNASTHNIQIDSGVGNTILYNGATSQDIILNTDGASVTIRRMTATQFMVI